MPIVVKAVSKVEYHKWLAEQKAKNAPQAAEAAHATAVDAMQATPSGTGEAQPAARDESDTPTPEKAEPVTQ